LLDNFNFTWYKYTEKDGIKMYEMCIQDKTIESAYKQWIFPTEYDESVFDELVLGCVLINGSLYKADVSFLEKL